MVMYTKILADIQDKLKAEEYLYHYIKKEEFPFIILRLPDVIGPFDDTSRFWAYVKWITQYTNHPIQMVFQFFS